MPSANSASGFSLAKRALAKRALAKRALATKKLAKKALAGAAGAAAIGTAAMLAGTWGAAAWAAQGTTASGGPTASGGSAGSGGSSSLGGFQLSAAGAGISASYEQPNFPVPATPTFELNLGYSHATYDFGPIGQATASTLWPGQVIAGSGSQLGALFPGVPLPPAPNWPVQAHSAYPQGPTSARDDQGAAVMSSSTSPTASVASASIGSGGTAAVPSGIATIQSAASNAESTVKGGEATARTQATVHGVDILGGLVRVSTIVSSATGSSNGTRPSLSGTSTLSGVSVAGQSVEVGPGGISGGSKTVPLPSLPLPLGQGTLSVNQILSEAGISIGLANPSGGVNGPEGTRELQGLQVKINLATLDSAAGKLSALLPPQVTANLPLPVPDEQVLVLDIGWVSVAAAATPPFDLSFPRFTGGSSLPSTAGAGSLPSPYSAAAAPGASGGITSGPSGSTGSPAGAGSSSPAASPRALLALAGAEPAALFRGIGKGLLVLALLLGLVGASVLLKADALIGAGGAEAACSAAGALPPVSRTSGASAGEPEPPPGSPAHGGPPMPEGSPS